MSEKTTTLGWGIVGDDGSEIWDSDPVFRGERVRLLDRVLLLFYPKKFFLYRFIRRHVEDIIHRYRTIAGGEKYRPVVVDVGCGTGATVIDFKKWFGRGVEVAGFDVVEMQVEIAQEKMKHFGVWASIKRFDGYTLPYDAESVDVVYSSDVLGHVHDVPRWLEELHRVLRDGGVLAMFAESALGRHAYIRNYLMRRGLNVDPHKDMHISLYSKDILIELLEQAGFEIEKMYTTVWAKFFAHPNELYPAFEKSHGFPILKSINWFLCRIKKLTHPVSTAIAELYSFIEMLFLGRWIESQGYVILARKK